MSVQEVVSLAIEVSAGPVSVSVAVPLDGDEVVTVIAVVLTITEVMTVIPELGASEVAKGIETRELSDAVMLPPALEVKLGIEDTGPVPELHTDEAKPELLA